MLVLTTFWICAKSDTAARVVLDFALFKLQTPKWNLRALSPTYGLRSA